VEGAKEQGKTRENGKTVVADAGKKEIRGVIDQKEKWMAKVRWLEWKKEYNWV